jgi:hypothetical protein
VFQGFVRENPISEDKTPENPIRRFIIGPQIFATIKSALMDPELEELPTDMLRGLDFRIAKTSKGGYADYNTSKWSRKESALTEAEQAAVDQYGLFDLSSFMPKKPTDVELKVMKEMFEASVDGQPYDTERWGQYYRPAGVQAPAGSSTESAAPTVATVVKSAAPVEDDLPFEPDAPAHTAASAPVESKPAGGQNAQDILAMIRARNQK